MAILGGIASIAVTILEVDPIVLNWLPAKLFEDPCVNRTQSRMIGNPQCFAEHRGIGRVFLERTHGD